MEKVPELTKEEYIRFELTKALLIAKPSAASGFISGEVMNLAEVILTGSRFGDKPANPDSKS